MLYDAIDHVILPVPDIAAAVAPFARLGLTLFPGARHTGRGTENGGFFVGGASNGFYVEALGVADREEARAAHGDAFVQTAEQGRGLSGFVLRTADLATAAAALVERGLTCLPEAVLDGAGNQIADIAVVRGPGVPPFDLRLIQYYPSHEARWARREAAGLLRHAFPLKRLDHLAAVAADLEADTGFWRDTLGVPLFGEVRTAMMIIRQFKIGDAIFELLGPATPDSPIASRPPALASMCAFETPDLAQAVTQGRAVGFTAPDPGPGPLPGTRVSTIPAAEFSGIGLQLLEYV